MYASVSATVLGLSPANYTLGESYPACPALLDSAALLFFRSFVAGGISAAPLFCRTADIVVFPRKMRFFSLSLLFRPQSGTKAMKISVAGWRRE